MTVVDPSWERTGKASCHSKIEQVFGENRDSEHLRWMVSPSEPSAPPSMRLLWLLGG